MRAVRACVELVRSTGAVACLQGSAEMTAFLAAAAANANADARAPLALLRPEQESTVEAVIAFCKENSLSVSILGGGHTCHSAAAGTICLDLRELNKCVVLEMDHAPGAVIQCQGGASLGQIARVAAEKGYVVPLGTAPTVGAGAVLMGGVGHLSRLLGMSVTNIHGLRIVTPGHGLQVLGERDVGDDDGLFWAARGGAPGFGVVTEFTLGCFPSLGPWTVRHDTTIIESSSDATCMSDFLQKYGASAPSNPRECTTDCYIYFTGNTTNPNGSNSGGSNSGGGEGSTSSSICNTNHRGTPSTVCGISCTLSTFTPTTLNSGSVVGSLSAYDDEGSDALSKTATAVTVPCVANLFEHEYYLSVEPPANTAAHARSVFLSALSPHAANILATGMIDAPEGIHCTLHIQQGGGIIREVEKELQCAGDVGGWEFSVVVTAFIPHDMDEDCAEVCRMWVDGLVGMLCVESRETIGVYATDLGPGRDQSSSHGGLAGRCWTESTRRRLATAKQLWDPTGVLRSHVPFVTTGVSYL